MTERGGSGASGRRERFGQTSLDRSWHAPRVRKGGQVHRDRVEGGGHALGGLLPRRVGGDQVRDPRFFGGALQGATEVVGQQVPVHVRHAPPPSGTV